MLELGGRVWDERGGHNILNVQGFPKPMRCNVPLACDWRGARRKELPRGGASKKGVGSHLSWCRLHCADPVRFHDIDDQIADLRDRTRDSERERERESL